MLSHRREEIMATPMSIDSACDCFLYYLSFSASFSQSQWSQTWPSFKVNFRISECRSQVRFKCHSVNFCFYSLASRFLFAFVKISDRSVYNSIIVQKTVWEKCLIAVLKERIIFQSFQYTTTVKCTSILSTHSRYFNVSYGTRKVSKVFTVKVSLNEII